jgi:hypothetical protein
MALSVNKRQVTIQDVSWFLDLSERQRLDLEPPYQRRSVWSISDRRFFLSTIFNNFPTPALFLHRTMESGRATYHVVDGKQRLETIIKYARNAFPLSDDFGDERLDKKRFSQLDEDMKNVFWNYQLIVEQITSADNTYIREVFDRVNRNTRKLSRQEIRHARFDGWFAKRVDAEAEAEGTVWRHFGIVTAARARRMADSQFIAEMLMLTIKKELSGFDQDMIDDYYSAYEDPAESEPDFDIESFEEEFARTKQYLADMFAAEPEVAELARTVTHFYSLWALLTLNAGQLPEPNLFAQSYRAFMATATSFDMETLGDVAQTEGEGLPPEVRYYLNAQAAPTDLTPRTIRHEALRKALINDEGAAGDSVSASAPDGVE